MTDVFTARRSYLISDEGKDRLELERVTKAAPGKFETVTGHDHNRDHQVTFKGKRIATADTGPDDAVTIYLTPKSQIAVFGSTVYSGGETALDVFPTFAEFEKGWQNFPDVIKTVSSVLGKECVEVLDI